MGKSRRFLALCAASATAIGASAVGCSGSDNTEICVGPDCPQYDGVGGGRNFFRSVDPDTSPAGSTAAGGDSDNLPDAGGTTPEEWDGGTTITTDADTTPPTPCEIAFVTPTAGDAGALTVDGASDVDGEACGAEFSLLVELTSSASRVTLFVNDTPLATQDVVDGAVSFDAVLGNRGVTPNVLRAQATMSDNRTCSLTLPNTILVDCLGPSCSITAPVANDDGYLNASQDTSLVSSGFQTNIVVGTEIANLDRNVRLNIDGAFDTVPDAVVADNNGDGSATFSDVTLAEGLRSMRAECSDSSGLTTLSAPASFNVDVTPCTITISSIASGANPITPGDDQSPGVAGIQVLAQGQINGGDCKLLRIGICDGPLAPLALSLPPDGSFSLPVTLTGSTGALNVCGEVEDLAGNVSAQEQITVNLRLDPPQVAIVSPSTDTRFNLRGTSGAVIDGDPLTSTCEATVVANCTEVGQPVDLLADGSPIAQATCVAQGGLSPFLGQATFAASLASKNDGSATVLTTQQAAAGLPTGVSAGVSIQADCEVPICNLVNPDPNLNVLNANLDSSGAVGFQLDVDVESDTNSLGQSVGLIIDGNTNGTLNAPLVARGPGPLTASFVDVALTEGLHTVQAQCVDAAGNTNPSTTESWTVDSVAPVPSITAPGCGSQLTMPENDANLAAPGLQFDVVVANDGVADTFITLTRGASSSTVSATGDLSSTTFSALDLGGPGSVELVACVTDAAGNQGCSASCTLTVIGHPSLSVQSPADQDLLTTSTPDCDGSAAGLDVTVLGTSNAAAGSTVQIQIGAGALAATTVNGGQYSACVAAPQGLGQSLTVTVTDGTTALSTSTSVQVSVDSVAPVPSITAPDCNTTLGIPGDDVDLDADGLQFDVVVANDGVPDTTITLNRGASSSNASATGNLISTNFDALDLGGSGSIELVACVTDSAGNQGCTPSCPLNIEANPSIALTSPSDLALLSTASDCDSSTAGLQVTVRGTTDAAAGSAVQLRIGSGTIKTTIADGTGFSDCVEAPDGNNQTLSASVIDQTTTLLNATSILVSISPGTIAAPSFSVPAATRRKGNIQLNWRSIVNPNGAPLSFYRLRCAPTDISTEGAWTAASVIPVTSIPPATAGSTETELFLGLDKPGMTRFCVIRGEDDTGLLSPISAGLSVNLTNPFHTQEFTVTDDVGTNLNLAVEPIGDIDGDGIDDFAYGASDIGVEVFLGRNDPEFDSDLSDVLPHSFSISNGGAVGPALGFGAEVAGLGDINGDGRDDFAVSARLGNTAFIFFGRPSNTWTDISLTTMSPCPADLCLIGSGLADNVGLFGWDLHSANFDGTGARDVVISGRRIPTLQTNGSTQANGGRVYVLFGGPQLAAFGPTINLPTGTSVAQSAADPDGFVINAPDARTNFGISVSTITGTGGVEDLIIGANGGALGATIASVVRVTGRTHPGGTGLVTINATTADEIDNSASNANLGNPVRALGDLDGDGRQDVAAWRNISLGNGVNVYRGLPGGGFNRLAGNLLRFTNDLLPGLDDNYGTFIARSFDSAFCKTCQRRVGTMGPTDPTGMIGDLDQDGFSELLIGATTPQAGTAGLGTLFYGPTGGSDRARSTADFSYTPRNRQVVPNFVGDINGDKFPDFAILDSGAGPNKVFLMY